MSVTITPVKTTHVSGKAAEERYALPANRDLFKARTPAVNAGDVAAKEEEIRQYFHATYEIMEKVFDCLKGAESYTVRPIHKLRHPMVFYYGHTCSFYINKLVVAGLTERINPKFEEMFAIGVDEMSWDDLNEAHYSWPTIEEVSEYRLLVRDRLNELMTSHKHALTVPLRFDESTKNDANAFWWILLMGCEHERIHIETASVHVRELPMAYVNPDLKAFWDCCPDQSGAAPKNSMVEVAGGETVLGRTADSATYGWDCDYGDGSKVQIAGFKASKYLVSNAEFYEFVVAGGYQAEKYWDKEGWNWVSWKKPEHPWFWVKAEGKDQFRLRLQVEEIALPWSWPAEINHLEATAFLAWRGEKDGKTLRLPTEAEWLLMHDQFVKKDQHEWAEGCCPGNVNLEQHRSSCPVDKNNHGGLFDVIGNVWHHIDGAVYPYRGFEVQPFYDDFSMPTFDGRHSCMKGGAWVSSGNEATRDSRFAFRRHFFQFIGVRYLQGGDCTATNCEPCKAVNVGMDPEVEATTHFAFAETMMGVPNANVAIADHAKAAFKAHAGAGVTGKRALDLYCGAGRVSFELTSDFAEVIGSDFTSRKLMPAFAMRERGDTGFSTRSRPLGAVVKTAIKGTDFPWSASREQALFFQADPSNLHSHMANFDLIVAFNVLENTHRPEAVPSHLLSRLNKGGILVVASTFDWKPICGLDRDVALLAESGDPEAEIVALLGSAVKQVSPTMVIPAFFPATATTGKLAAVTVMTFRKD